MKKALLIASLSIASFVFKSALALNIGVVDVQKIFSSSHGINEIQSKLETQFAGERNNMINMIKKIQSEKKSFEKNGTVMSSEKRAAAEAKLKSDQSKLQIAQANYQKSVMSAQQKAMKGFITKIKTAADAVAEKEKLDLVFVSNSILYAKSAKDITSGVMGKLN